MSAEARASRKIRAQAYAGMPSREVFQAAAEYEKARLSNVSAMDAALVQRAQFAGMVLGNPEVPKAFVKRPEKYDELVDSAHAFFKAMIDQSTAMVGHRDELEREEDEGEAEEDNDGLHAV